MRSRRPLIVGTAAIAAVLGLAARPVSAITASQSSATLWIDHESFVIPLTVDATTGISTLNATVNSADPNGAGISLSGIFDPDPFLSFSVSVIDFGAPSIFSFAFTTPIVAVVSPNVVSSELTGTLTDFAGNGVSLTPLGIATMISSVSFPATNMGVDIGDAESHAAGAPGASYIYGPYAAGPIAGPSPGVWTQLSIDASFTLSGDGDSASLSGTATINEGRVPGAVPEPTTAGLGLLALAGLAAAVTRRR